jgi:hypothetical protein
MHRLSAGLAACLVAVLAIGCGSVQAARSGPQGQRSSAPVASSAAARGPASCHGAAAAITQADNGETFCVKVGARVTVLLHSRDSSLWLAPLASGGALKPVPSGMASLVKGVTGAWYAAVRPGHVLVTSVRPPCYTAISASGGKGGLEPADSVPRSYPLRFCAPGHRFSVSIVVAR